MKDFSSPFGTFIVAAILLTASPVIAQTKSADPQETVSSTPNQPNQPKPSQPSSDEEKPSGQTRPTDNQRKASPWEILTEGASDHNLVRRQEAVAALGTIGPKERAVRLVVAALGDREPSVRQLAARDLGEMRAKSAIPKLREALKDESTEVCFAAAKSLWDMGDRSGREVFIGILAGEKSGSSGMVKDGLTSAKKKLQDPRGLAVVGAEEAATALFGPAGWGIKVMQEATKDRSASARAMSATLLAHDNNEGSIQQLDNALWDKNWLVREAAAQALGASRQREQISYLQDLLQDDKPAVRYMAAASIIRLSTSKRAHGSTEPAQPPDHAAALRTPTTSK
jgi:HEAT repeat protein